MKKSISVALALILLMTVLPVSVSAAAPIHTAEAQKLNELGLFNGSGTDASGKPNFDLGRAPTRIEALVMLIRILGKDKEALSTSATHPFTDVPAWADRYAAYAYENGITTGIGDNKFGAAQNATSAQYLTYMLRALGYDDKAGDFVYSKAHEKAAEVGMIPAGSYSDAGAAFLRDDCAKISFDALSVKLKDSDNMLVDKLLADYAISDAAVASVGLATSDSAVMHMTYDTGKKAYRMNLADLLALFPTVKYLSCSTSGSPLVQKEFGVDYLLKASSAAYTYMGYHTIKSFALSVDDVDRFYNSGLILSGEKFALITIHDANEDFLAYALWQSGSKETLLFRKVSVKMADLAAELQQEVGTYFDRAAVIPYDAVSIGEEKHIPVVEFDEPELNEGWTKRYMKIDDSLLPASVRNYKYFFCGGFYPVDLRGNLYRVALNTKYPLNDTPNGIGLRNESGLCEGLYSNLTNANAPGNYFCFFDENYNLLGYIAFSTPAKTFEMPAVRE